MTARPELDWGRILLGAHRPEEYQARGDGTVNDQAAVQSAINAAAAANATCLIEGIYRCDSQVVMPSNTAILFTNPNAALIKNYSSGNNFANSFLISQNNIVSPTGATITNGSAVITNLSTTTGIVTNDLVTGPGIDAGSLVLSVDSASQITMTKPAVAGSSGSTINCSTKANDIRITGPGSIYASSTSMLGIIIGIYGDRFTFEDFHITCWAKADAISGAGDHWRGTKVFMTGSDGQLGTTGLRYQGGDGSVFDRLHIESGDDALQMVPGGSAGSALFNQSITRCTYLACTGSSAMARFMAVLLKAAAGPGGMSNSITDSQFIACRGFGNTRAIFVFNRDSTGDIDGVTFQDCSVDTANSQNVTFFGCTVANTGAGGVAQVTNLDTSQISAGLTVSGTGLGGLTVVSIDTGNQITLSGPATVTGTNQTVTFGGYSQTLLINRSVGTSPGVLYYSGVGNVKNIYVRRVTIKNPVGTNTTISTAGTALQNIYIEDCVVPASPNASASVVNILQTTTVRVRGGQIDCGGHNVTGVVFGGVSNPNSDSLIDGTRIIGVANGDFGVSFNNNAGGRMRNVRVEQYSGQTTAKAWKTTSSSSATSIRDCDFSQLSNASKFLDQATDTVVGDNNLGDTTTYGSPYNAGAAGGVGGPAKLIYRTTDATPINNSSVLVSDAVLTFAMGASDVWQVEVYLLINAPSTTSDFKCALSVPTGATGYWGVVGNVDTNITSWGPAISSNTPVGMNTAFTAIAAGSFNGTFPFSGQAIIQGDGTHSGSVTVQYAQNTATAENTTVKALSWLRATRIA